MKSIIIDSIAWARPLETEIEWDTPDKFDDWAEETFDIDVPEHLVIEWAPSEFRKNMEKEFIDKWKQLLYYGRTSLQIPYEFNGLEDKFRFKRLCPECGQESCNSNA